MNTEQKYAIFNKAVKLLNLWSCYRLVGMIIVIIIYWNDFFGISIINSTLCVEIMMKWWFKWGNL